MLDIFGFTKQPFIHSLSTAEVFQWQGFREGLKRLEYGLKSRGLLCMVGRSGSGKTTLLRFFTAMLEPGLYRTITVHQTSGTTADLLSHISHQLGLEGSNRRGRLIQRIQSQCAQIAAARINPLLVIDEAHYLNDHALHELRLLMTSQLDVVRNFILILSGHDDLEGRLRIPSLLPLKHRITTWIRLDGLLPDETPNYLLHRLNIAGVPANLFSPEAVFALHQLSGGLIRSIDSIAHHALLACASDRGILVTPDHVRLAAEELGL